MKRKKDVVWCFECKYYDNTAKAPFYDCPLWPGNEKEMGEDNGCTFGKREQKKRD